MLTENQRRWKKIQREEKKKIEKQLHPVPVFNNIEILHEHLRNGKIRFTAWEGDCPVDNGKQFVVPREWVLRHAILGEFYMLYKKDMVWLTTREI